MSIRFYRRVAVPVAPKSQEALESYAEDILRRFYPNNLRSPAALDVITLLDLLEEPPYRVVFGISRLTAGDEGYADPEKRELIVDKDVYEAAVNGDGRARSTCAHEIGHIPHIDQISGVVRLHPRLLARVINVRVPVYQDPEWQARVTGAALLIPRSTAGQVYRAGGLAAVESTFQVSHGAAEVRIEVLQRKGWL